MSITKSMLNYDNWISETKRGLFTPRSSKLEAIDHALKTYKTNPSQQNLKNILKTLNSWQKAKGQGDAWRRSTRNRNGAVDKLLLDIKSKEGGDHFVSAHGGRNAGTSTGTFVVPKGLEIHLYVADGGLLENSIAIPLYRDLTRPIGHGRVCPTFVKRIAPALDTVPNYIAFGAEHQGINADPVFLGYPTGIYQVGKQTPSLPIPDGQQMKLSEIVYSKKPHLTGSLHWLCCRENMNPNRAVKAYKPSEVKAYHGVWRD